MSKAFFGLVPVFPFKQCIVLWNRWRQLLCTLLFSSEVIVILQLVIYCFKLHHTYKPVNFLPGNTMSPTSNLSILSKNILSYVEIIKFGVLCIGRNSLLHFLCEKVCNICSCILKTFLLRVCYNLSAQADTPSFKSTFSIKIVGQAWTIFLSKP